MKRVFSPFIVFVVLVWLISAACTESGNVGSGSQEIADSAQPEVVEAAPASEQPSENPPADSVPQVVIPVAELDYEAEVLSMEAEQWSVLSNQIVVQPLSDQDRTAINAMLAGGENVGLGSLSADPYGNVQLSSIGDPGTILIPMAQLTPADLNAFYTSLSVAKPYADSMWFSLFHWTNHMANPYALSANSAWVAQIVRGGLTGFGDVYYFAGGGGMQDQYLFLTRVVEASGQARVWGTFLAAENGAVVTSYNPGMQHGTYSAKELARFMSRMVGRGYTRVDPSQVPQHIKDSWGGNAPSIWRHLYWTLGYQLRAAAAAAQVTIPAAIEAALIWTSTTITDFIPLLFVVPEDPCWFMPAACTIKS